MDIKLDLEHPDLRNHLSTSRFLETGNMASLRCAAMMRSMRPRVSPAAMRSMGSYGPSTDSQPNSVDNKFSSDRLDKVRAFSLPK